MSKKLRSHVKRLHLKHAKKAMKLLRKKNALKKAARSAERKLIKK